MKSCLLVTCSYLILSYDWYGKNLNAFCFIIIVSLFASCLIDLSKSGKRSCGHIWEWCLRETQESGHWCVVLLPISIVAANMHCFTDLYCGSLIDLSLLLLSNTLILNLMTLALDWIVYNGEKHAFKAVKTWNKKLEKKFIVAFGIIMLIVESCSIIAISRTYKALPDTDAYLYTVFTLVALIMQSNTYILLPKLLPRSFTMGEAAICSQAVALLVFSTLSNILHKVHIYGLNSKYLQTVPNVVAFMEVATLSCILVILAVSIVPMFRRSLSFYFLVPSIAMIFSLPVLYPVLKQDFISWLVAFIVQDRLKLTLFAYWCGTNFLAIIVVYWNTLPCFTPIPSQSHSSKSANKKHELTSSEAFSNLTNGKSSRSQKQKAEYRVGKNVNRLSTLVRKQFHLVAIVAVLPGLIFDIKIASLAVTCGVIVFVMLECVRVLNVWPIGRILNLYLPLYVDHQDQGIIILTHIYLLTALAIPLWLWDLNAVGITPLPLFSGLLSVGIGDAVASIVGTRFGRFYWPGSKKTIEGTSGAIISQLLSLKLLELLDLVGNIRWLTVALVIISTSTLEALTEQIDNLVLPLYTFSLLMSTCQ